MPIHIRQSEPVPGRKFFKLSAAIACALSSLGGVRASDPVSAIAADGGTQIVGKEGKEAAKMHAGADMVVYIEKDGVVYAQSGRDGKIVAQSHDASATLQAAIDALPREGGRIDVAAGCYWLERTLHIEDKHGVRLQGAARGIVFSQGMEGTVLRSKHDIDLVEIFGNKVKSAGVSINYLHLIGSGKANGKSGILVRGETDLLSLHKVGVNHCGIGIYLKGGDGEMNATVDAPSIQFCDPQVNGIGLKIERCHYGKIVGGEFADCDDYGIVLSSPDSGHGRATGIKIIGATVVRHRRAGILVGRNTEDITIAAGTDVGSIREGSGIVISDEGTGNKPVNIILSAVHSYNNRHAGIAVESCRHLIVMGCICSGHNHAWVKDVAPDYGIHVMPGAEDVVLQGNITYGNTKRDILDESRVNEGSR